MTAKLAGLLLAIASASVSAQIAGQTACPPSARSAGEIGHDAETARNRIVVEAFVDMFYRKREVERALLTYVSPDYIQHSPKVPTGRAVMLEMARHSDHSLAKLDVKRVMVDGDMATIHVKGQLKPTMPVEAVIDMYRLKDGKIVEHWDVIEPVPSVSKNTNTMF